MEGKKKIWTIETTVQLITMILQLFISAGVLWMFDEWLHSHGLPLFTYWEFVGIVLISGILFKSNPESK